MIDLLLRRVVLLHQLDVAGEIEARALQQRLVTHARRDLLLQLRLIRPRIDDRQFVAGLHVLPLVEQDLADLPVHLGLHVDGVIGLHSADAGQIDRHILGPRGGDHDGHRSRRGRDDGRRHRRMPDALHLVQRQCLEIHQPTDDQGDDAGQDQNHTHCRFRPHRRVT